MEITSPTPATPDATPDWSAISDDVICPLCEYNLRGLVEPRCPECGYKFTWQEMLDPTVRLHPYLFEHHPENELRALLKTFLGHLRPATFWKSLHPRQPALPTRLFSYWARVAALYVFTLLVFLAVLGREIARSNAAAKTTFLSVVNAQADANWHDQLVRRYGSIDAAADRFYPETTFAVIKNLLTGDNEVPFWAVLLLILVWPWLTLAFLLIFSTSMRRAKLTVIHLMRVVLYSSDVILWTCLYVWLLLFSLAVRKRFGFGPTDAQLTYGFLAIFGLCAVMWWYRLGAAFKHYLHIKRPLAIVFLTQFLCVLLLIGILIYQMPTFK